MNSRTTSACSGSRIYSVTATTAPGQLTTDGRVQLYAARLSGPLTGSERSAKCSRLDVRLTYLLAVTPWILLLAGPPAARNLADEIEDSSKTGAVGPGAAGPRVVRAQILLDRARFSPG